MRYAIHSYEESYGGLHGMEDLRVIECDSFEEAQNEAHNEAEEVVHSYECLEDWYRQEAIDTSDFEEDTVEFDDYYNECVSQGLCWEIYEVREDVTESTEELDRLFVNDKEEFLERYTDGICLV